MTSDWQLKSIDNIEPAGWQALKCTENVCVVAGPGAGKTEFLAQKAAYLLEMGLCPYPFRILAISYKRSSAENLKERVQQRCKIEHASRFESTTFDSFTKSLVDRFQLTLPEEWRLSSGYTINTNFKDIKYQIFLTKIKENNPKHHNELAAIKATDFRQVMLPLHKILKGKPKTLNEYVCNTWFKQLRASNEVDFVFINRLADFILRENNSIRNAIKQTYKFIFVDEFQDTSYSQYDLLDTLILDSSCKVTAVGDNKQSIMRFAGARPDAFNKFEADFKAGTFQLLMNYRSSPELVRIQHFLATSIEPECLAAQSGVNAAIAEEVAQIWNFTNPAIEPQYIADWIISDSKKRNLLPKDYAILVRQKADDFYEVLTDCFSKNSLRLRNESQIFNKLSMQDILSDDLFIILSALLRLGIQDRAPASWTIAAHYFVLLYGEEGEKNRLTINSDGYLASLLNDFLRPKIKDLPFSPDSVIEISDVLVDKIGIDSMKGSFPYYAAGDNLEVLIASIKEFLIYCANQSNTWQQFIDIVDGVDQVPLLTIHKSKGLEYDTVIFMGFDDKSWWSYSSDNAEGKATFFVALSRAKQRVIFTYSKGESGRNRISELYDLLTIAGVPEIAI